MNMVGIPLLLMMSCNEYSYMQHGETPGHLAMKIGCFECVALLCKYGANFNIRDNSSRSPVDIATALGNKRCLNVYNNVTSESQSIIPTCASPEIISLPHGYMW